LELNAPDRHSEAVPAAPVDSPETPERSRRVTPYRVVALLIVVGMVALWAYVLTRKAEPPPDKLDDPAFAVNAQAVCESTMTQLDQLPQAFQSATPSDRADVVAESNEDLGFMLDSLRATVPTAERDQGMLDEWLGDWQLFLDNRIDYVNRLRADKNARIYVAEKDGAQITVAVDRFAEVNDMPACRTPKDIS
jgi:hypothetical protein